MTDQNLLEKFKDTHNLTSQQVAELERYLAEYQGEDRVITAEELEAVLADRDQDVEVIPTRFPHLDNILGGGVQKGELITVTGVSGEGKTTLAMSMTRNMINRDGVSIGWFSYEVTPQQFVDKIKAPGFQKAIPQFYTPREYVSGDMDWLYQRILEAKAKYNVDVVFVDNLHDVLSQENLRKGQTALEIGSIVGKIKAIARDLGIAIFLSVHIKKPKRGKEPTQYDMRDSGRIVDTSDTIIGVWRIRNDNDGTNNRVKKPRPQDTRGKVEVLKNRRNATKSYTLVNHDEHHFKEIDMNQEQQDWDAL